MNDATLTQKHLSNEAASIAEPGTERSFVLQLV
jgi:hypothetical protein